MDPGLIEIAHGSVTVRLPYKEFRHLVRNRLLPEVIQALQPNQDEQKQNARTNTAADNPGIAIPSEALNSTAKNMNSSTSDHDVASQPGSELPCDYSYAGFDDDDNNGDTIDSDKDTADDGEGIFNTDEIHGASNTPKTPDAGDNGSDIIIVDSFSHNGWGMNAEKRKRRSSREDYKPADPTKELKEKCSDHKNGQNKGDLAPRKDPPVAYRTSSYDEYSWEEHRERKVTNRKWKGTYKHYKKSLVLIDMPPSNFNFNIKNTPYNDVRLDDKWVGLVAAQIDKDFSRAELGRKWPAEFDLNGKIRSLRTPLGNPCLIWVEKGQIDIDGEPAPADGCYYGWFAGIQILCGCEGHDNGLFTPHRRSPEEPRCVGITFKISHPALGGEKDTLLIAGKVRGGVARVVAKHDYLGHDNDDDNDNGNDQS